jgi:hypothetical protein
MIGFLSKMRTLVPIFRGELGFEELPGDFIVVSITIQ